MRKNGANSGLILLTIILILFLIGYFLVPFLNYGWMTKIFKPCCKVKEIFQGENYLPVWCLEGESIEQEEDKDIEKENQQTEENNDDESFGLANPAAVKCVEDRGELESYTTPAGEAALCVFEDNSICNQWAYYRGECEPGECFKVCKQIGTSMEGWYISCTDELIELAECGDKESEEEVSEEDEVSVSIGSIKVTSPEPNQQLSSPFKVDGQAIVFEDKVYIRVKNTGGKILIEESTTARHQPGTEWGDFSIEIKYEFKTTEEGFVEVYSLDQSGKEMNLVRIPVKF